MLKVNGKVVETKRCFHCPGIFYFDEADMDSRTGKPKRKNLDGSLHFDRGDPIEEPLPIEEAPTEEKMEAPKPPSASEDVAEETIVQATPDVLAIKFFQRDLKGNVIREYSIQRIATPDIDSAAELVNMDEIASEALSQMKKHWETRGILERIMN